jgi:putative ABC transport system substrate-binding protein
MKRRSFIALLGGAAVAWPLTARAQQSAMPVIGMLGSVSPVPHAPFVAAIKEGLQQTGYVEGRNVAIEYRWAEGQYDRLPQQATELVNRGVAVIILVGGGPTTAAAKVATATIPIVFITGEDPVKSGAVAALNRPGGNATGVSLLTVATEAKRLQLLHELVPNVAVVAIIVNPNNPQADEQLPALQAAAHTLGLQVQVFKASSPNEIDTAFANLVQQRAGAVVSAGDALFLTRREQLVVLPTRASHEDYMQAGFSRAKSRRRCRSNRQSRSNWSSICKRQRHSASPFRCPCSDVPTR